MKTALLNYRTRRALSKRKTESYSTQINGCSSVGIVYTAEDLQKFDAISSFANGIRLLGIYVKLLEYQPSKKNLHFSGSPAFTEKQIGLFGTINNPVANGFMATSFDYLLLADREPGPVIRYILAHSLAHCKAGRNSAGVEPYLDFMLEINGEWKDLLETIFSFVRRLT